VLLAATIGTVALLPDGPLHSATPEAALWVDGARATSASSASR
jgi:hypothetical protein